MRLFLLQVDRIIKAPFAQNDENVMRANIQRALASDLQDLSGEFRKSQESYLQALQSRKERSQRKLGPTNVIGR
jgi:hypothetical protein